MINRARERRQDAPVRGASPRPKAQAQPTQPDAGDETPRAVTTTSPVRVGSTVGLPFRRAATFQGAPSRIQSRFDTKCSVRPGSSVPSHTNDPAGDPTCTDSQQGPRVAASVSRATAGTTGVVCAGVVTGRFGVVGASG